MDYYPFCLLFCDCFICLASHAPPQQCSPTPHCLIPLFSSLVAVHLIPLPSLWAPLLTFWLNKIKPVYSGCCTCMVWWSAQSPFCEHVWQGLEDTGHLFAWKKSYMPDLTNLHPLWCSDTIYLCHICVLFVWYCTVGNGKSKNDASPSWLVPCKPHFHYLFMQQPEWIFHGEMTAPFTAPMKCQPWWGKRIVLYSQVTVAQKE